MEELATKKKALSKISSSFQRKLDQPKLQKDLEDRKKARELLSTAFQRSFDQYSFRQNNKREKRKAEKAKKIEERLLRNQEAYLQDIESRLPVLEKWTKYHEREQEKVLQPQRELINREIMKQRQQPQAANIIKQSLQQTKQKANMMQAIKEYNERKRIDNSSRKRFAITSSSNSTFRCNHSSRTERSRITQSKK
jgi:hypothetical protein